jgi:ABC-2 type transport system ATP-binding protein
VVRALRERHGVTIVLSTHYLEEAQEVCDRVAIVDKGLIVEEGKPSELVEQLGNEVADLVLADDHDATKLLAALDVQAGHIVQGGSGVSIISTEPREQLTDRISSLPLTELGVTTMTVRPATLNDVFLHLTASAPAHDLATAAGSWA